MSISTSILNFAAGRLSFSRSELLEYLSDLSDNSLSQQLYRLVKANRLERIGHGIYRLPASYLPISNEMEEINSKLKEQFPFVHFCLWSSDFIMPFMHHIPELNYIYIDVEREATEAIFYFLKNELHRPVFFRPSKEEYQRYIVGNQAVIIRALISESPLLSLNNMQVPTLEKILVDIVDDIEFDFLQGTEILYFYRNVLDSKKINKRKLFRYATRRGRLNQVKKLYNDALWYYQKVYQ